MFVQYNENVTKYCAQKAWNFIFFIINKIILELSFHLPTYYYSFNCLLFTFRTKKYKIILKDWKMLFQSLVILMKLLQKSLLFQSFVILTELMLFSRTDADKVVAGKVTPTPPHPTGLSERYALPSAVHVELLHEGEGSGKDHSFFERRVAIISSDLG